jgi:hypothetical protein
MTRPATYWLLLQGAAVVAGIWAGVLVHRLVST